MRASQRKRLVWLGILAAMLSCSSEDTPLPTTNLVIIRDNIFDPPNIVVAVGRPVFWRHEGGDVHTVTSGTPVANPGTLFDSGNLGPGGAFTFTFSSPGSFSYFCRIHGAAQSGNVSVR